MTRLFASFTQRIAGEGSAAWDIHYTALKRKAAGDDVIVLSVGDPDFDTPTPIVDAAVASLRAGDTHYADYRGETRLRELIAAQQSQRCGVSYNADEVVVVAGAQCGLFAVAMCLFDPGDEVIVPEPMYVTYEAVFGAAHARVVNVALNADADFNLNVADIAARISAKTRAIFLNTPQNPTGSCIDRDRMEQIAALCLQHDLWLIIDEVYADLVFEQAHVNPAAWPGMKERTISISSLSKSHAMTGWRLGWVVAPTAVVEHIANLALCMLYGSPAFIQQAAITALSHQWPQVAAMREAYRQRRDRLCAVLRQQPGIKVFVPQGGMFVMLDIGATGLSSKAFAQHLLDHYGVSVLAGVAFGPSIALQVRLSLAASEADLARAAERIVRCCAELIKQP